MPQAEMFPTAQQREGVNAAEKRGEQGSPLPCVCHSSCQRRKYNSVLPGKISAAPGARWICALGSSFEAKRTEALSSCVRDSRAS